MAVDAESVLPALASAAAAAIDGRPRLLAVVAPARTDVDCAALFTEDGPFSLVWEQPDREVALVGRGIVRLLEAEDTAQRFRSMARRVDELFDDLTVVTCDGSPLEPVLTGGFSFSSTTDWRMGPGRLILPELSYIRRDGRAAWIRAVEVVGDTDVTAVAADVARELTRLSSLGGGWLPPRRLAPARPLDPASAAYPKLVQQAVEHIESGALQKVVAARAVTFDQDVNFIETIATLRATYPGCATFAFRLGSETFVGATPELLARTAAERVETMAVAGTAPRGESFDADHALGLGLLADPKELWEHDVVYGEIRARLQQAGVVLDEPRDPEVLKLPGLQHLWTRVTGTAGPATSLLDIVGRLHPTPAVAGVPADAAIRWLEDHEELDRGWYAGPVGYIGPSGDGEFRVALRCGLVRDHRVILYAGAGVVAGSTPDRELAETELKFQALGRAVRTLA